MADINGRKTGGRQKGTPNKKTVAQLEAMQAVAGEVLGVEFAPKLGPRDVLVRTMHTTRSAMACSRWRSRSEVMGEDAISALPTVQH